MKKILAILALATSGAVFAADTVSVEYQNLNGIRGSANQDNVNVGLKHDFNSVFAGDVKFFSTQTEHTNSVSSRIETGLTGAVPVLGAVKGYTRVALGEKYAPTGNFTYYSVEPGVSVPVTGALSANVGYRYRSAVDTSNNDTTRTWRGGVSYKLTQKDTIGLRYDNVRGDINQNVVAVNYARSF